MAWTEEAGGWNITETRTGTQATRVFTDGLTGGGSLPAMNAQHPSTSLQNLYVDGRAFNKIDQSGKQRAIITYSPFTNEQPDPNSSFSALPRKWRISGEFLSIEGQSELFWKSTGDLVNQNTFKRIVNETYIVTEVVTDMDTTNAAGKHANIINAAGKLNSATWEGFGKGNWLYMGADIDEQFTSSGGRTFRIEHNFAARIITGSSEGWQRVYNQVTGGWDQISDSPGFNEDGQLYAFTNFSSIFSATGA